MAKHRTEDEVAETPGEWTPDFQDPVEPAGEADPVAAARENRRVQQDQSVAAYNAVEPHTDEIQQNQDEPTHEEVVELASEEVATPDLEAIERPANSSNRPALDKYAQDALGLDPSEYGTKDELIAAIDKAEKDK